MNNNERVIIAYHYRRYCQNRVNSDPVGGYEDMRELFTDLADKDERLAEVMEEIEQDIFEE